MRKVEEVGGESPLFHRAQPQPALSDDQGKGFEKWRDSTSNSIAESGGGSQQNHVATPAVDLGRLRREFR